MAPYAYFPPYGLPTPHPYLVAAPAAPDGSTNARTNLRSSSLPSDVDNVERMIDYLVWLAKRTPTQSTMFAEAREALITAGHTFETVGMLGDEKFEKLGITEGVGVQIRMQVVRFKRAQAAGRV